MHHYQFKNSHDFKELSSVTDKTVQLCRCARPNISTDTVSWPMSLSIMRKIRGHLGLQFNSVSRFLVIMLYNSTKTIAKVVFPYYIFLYYNMLLRNAQISLKVWLPAFFNGCVSVLRGRQQWCVCPSLCDALRATASYPACQSCHH